MNVPARLAVHVDNAVAQLHEKDIAGNPERVLELLETHAADAAFVLAACQTLATVCHFVPSATEAQVDVIFGILQRFAQNAEITKFALRACAWLAENADNRVSLTHHKNHVQSCPPGCNGSSPESALAAFLTAMELHRTDRQVAFAGCSAIVALQLHTDHRAILRHGAHGNQAHQQAGNNNNNNNNNMRTRQGRLFLLHALVSAIRHHADDTHALEPACQALADVIELRHVTWTDICSLETINAVGVLAEAMHTNARHAPVAHFACRIVALLELNAERLGQPIAHLQFPTFVGTRHQTPEAIHRALASAVLDMLRRNAPTVDVALPALQFLGRNQACAASCERPSTFTAVVVDAVSHHRNNADVGESACRALALLVKDSSPAAQDGIRADVAAARGLIAVVDVLRDHQDHAGVAEQACCALSTLAEGNDANKQAIADLHGPELIIRALATFAHHADVAAQACSALHCLAWSHVIDGQIFELGGLDHIIAALVAHPASQQVAEHGCGAVQNVCANVNEALTRCRELQAIPVILSVIRRHYRDHDGDPDGDHDSDPVVLQRGLLAVANLAFASQNCTQILDNGGHALALRVMHTHRRDDRVVSAACFALANLVAHEDAARALLERRDHCLHSVLQAMNNHSFNQGVCEAGCRAIRNAAIHEPGRRLILSLGGVAVIIRAMAQHSAKQPVCGYGCSALHLLAQDDTDAAAILQLGGLQSVIKALRTHPAGVGVAKGSSGLLQALARNTRVRAEIVELGGLEALVAAGHRHVGNDRVLQEMCGALNALVADRRAHRSGAACAVVALVMRVRNHVGASGTLIALTDETLRLAQWTPGEVVARSSWHDEGVAWHTPDWTLCDRFDRGLHWVRSAGEDGAASSVYAALLPVSNPLYGWAAAQVNQGGIRVSRVEVVKSTNLTRAFHSQAHRILTRRADSGGVFNRDFGADDAVKAAMLEQLKRSFVHANQPHVNVVLGWHGCDERVVHSIVSGGAANLAARANPGYFGSGVYMTTSAQYAAGYATRVVHDDWREPNANGEHVMLLCAVCIGLAYPISRATDYVQVQLNDTTQELCRYAGASLVRQCDTHYIHISSKDRFHAPANHRQYNFDELVVAQEAQVLPIAKVYFKVEDRGELRRHLFDKPPVSQLVA